nr:hypothetical protein GCM10025699_12680 [Microbacterium flavescens]
MDAVATRDENGGGTTVFIVNRSLADEVSLEIDVMALGRIGDAAAQSLFDDDIHAANTLHDPERVAPRTNSSVQVGDGTVTITLPPVSWTVLTFD